MFGHGMRESVLQSRPNQAARCVERPGDSSRSVTAWGVASEALGWHRADYEATGVGSGTSCSPNWPGRSSALVLTATADEPDGHQREDDCQGDEDRGRGRLEVPEAAGRLVAQPVRIVVE